MRAHTLRVLACSTFVVVLGLTVACDRGNGVERSPERDTSFGHRLCIGKQHVSLQEGIRLQSFTVQLPTSDLASQSTVVDVCAAEGGGLVVEYASGLFVRQSINDLARPEEAWKGIVASSPDAGYRLGSIRGYPALLATPGGPLDLQGGVEWVEPTPEGDIKFKLESDGTIPLEEIEAAAESMAPVGGSEPTTTASPSGG